MAMPSSRAELDQIIEQQVGHAIGAPQIEAIRKLTEFFARFEELAVSSGVVKSELATIKSQLEGVLPQLERSTLAAVADFEGKAKGIDSKLTFRGGGRYCILDRSTRIWLGAALVMVSSGGRRTAGRYRGRRCNVCASQSARAYFARYSVCSARRSPQTKMVARARISW